MLKAVDVVGKKYRIIEVDLDAANGHAGRTMAHHCVIEVYHPQDEQAMRDTVLHEVLHACLFEAGKGDCEDVVASLAPTLLYVIRKNPKLIEFLTER